MGIIETGKEIGKLAQQLGSMEIQLKRGSVSSIKGSTLYSSLRSTAVIEPEPDIHEGLIRITVSKKNITGIVFEIMIVGLGLLVV